LNGNGINTAKIFWVIITRSKKLFETIFYEEVDPHESVISLGQPKKIIQRWVSFRSLNVSAENGEDRQSAATAYALHTVGHKILHFSPPINGGDFFTWITMKLFSIIYRSGEVASSRLGRADFSSHGEVA
jgi:hypothetical protein